jgi:predicted acetyltransferase
MVDVPAALEARQYAPGRMVVDVRDEQCAWNAGRYALESDGTMTECRTTTDNADLVVPVASLGTVYLGGARMSALARAGRAEARTEQALAVADAMFATTRAPWCPEHW